MRSAIHPFVQYTHDLDRIIAHKIKNKMMAAAHFAQPAMANVMFGKAFVEMLKRFDISTQCREIVDDLFVTPTQSC